MNVYNRHLPGFVYCMTCYGTNKRDAVIDWLNDHTSVIEVDDSTVVIQQF